MALQESKSALALLLALAAALLAGCARPGLSGEARRRYDDAITFRERGLLLEAAKELEQVKRIAPDHLPSRVALARVYTDLDRFEPAEAEIGFVLTMEPGHSGAQVARGRLLARRDRLEDAERTLRQCVAAAPRSVEALHELAVLLVRTGRAGEALGLFERARSLDSRLPYEVALRWGAALEASGKRDEARRMYEAALERSPETAGEAHSALGFLLLGEPAEAARGISLLEEGVRREPGNAAILDRLGHAYLRAGRFEEAHNLLQRALRASPPSDPASPGRRALLAEAEARLPRSPAPPGAPNVVLVVIDTLRRDHVGAYGYPRDVSPTLDAVAKRGVIVGDAVSQAPWTAPSMATMFTSLYPSAHGLDGGVRWGVPRSAAAGALPFGVQKTLSLSQVTLAEVLRRNGYRTAGFVSNTYVNSIFGFAQGFETYRDEHDDYSGRTNGKRRGKDTNRLVFDWLAARPAEPFFLFVHYNDPHLPYDPPAPYGAPWVAGYRGRLTPEITGAAAQRFGAPITDLAPEDVGYIVGLYDGEIRYADENLRRLIERLGAAKLTHRVLTVITSDHGEELLDHGSGSHGYTLYEEQLRVPLVFLDPGGLAPRRVEGPFGLIDLAPTILGLAGIRERPDAFQGRDLAAVLRGESAAPSALTFSEATYREPHRAARRPSGLKRIERPGKGETLLFDLGRDPRERTVLPAHPDADRLERALRDWAAANASLFGRLHPDGSNREVVLDEKVRERLKALGYIE